MFPQPVRNIDDDAPAAMRAEWVAIIFDFAANAPAGALTERRVYEIITGALGIPDPAANPYGGLQHRARQNVVQAEWARFYDLALRLWQEFHRHGDDDRYVQAVNAVFAAHGVVWQLTNDGQLDRVVPAAVQAAIVDAIDALRRPGYEAALQLFNLARDAFNDRPRRDRDAGANAFDAMEAAAKIQMNMPTRTFGAVLDAARNQRLINGEVAGVLQRVEVVRHNHLGHGMAAQFALTAAEVDLVYVSCAMGAKLFATLR